MTTITEAPRRWKTETDFTPAEAREFNRARRGFRPLPFFATDEWREHLDRQLGEIATRRDQAQRELHEAERELGIAVVEGITARGARKRIEDAHSDLQALDVAETEIARRDAEDAERQRQARQHADRVATYRWIADYLTRAAEVVQAREALARAEAAIAALGRNALLANTALARFRPEEVGIDRELAGACSGEIGPSMTIERCRELREKAERLAATEQRA